jgi:hypothetical protein
VSAETSREDPRHIFLEPECCADPSVGRCWAAHNEWPLDDCDVQAEATKYVRADLVAALERERDAATARAEAAEARRDLFDTQAAAAKVTAANAEAQRDAAIAERDALRTVGRRLLGMAASREYSASIGRHLAEHLTWPDDAPDAVHPTLEEARDALTSAKEAGE